MGDKIKGDRLSGLAAELQEEGDSFRKKGDSF